MTDIEALKRKERSPETDYYDPNDYLLDKEFDRGWNKCVDHLIAQGWGPRVPDGWKLVPVEPTEKMLLAGGKSPAGPDEMQELMRMAQKFRNTRATDTPEAE